MKTNDDFKFKNRKKFWNKFWFNVRVISVIVGVISFIVLIGSLINIFFIWLKHGNIPMTPMTEKDIVDLVRIKVDYEISFYWNLLFGWVWTLLLYLMFTSNWLKREIGKLMRNILISLIFSGGLYFSFVYGGIFYGLIISLIFLFLMLAVALSFFFFNLMKEMFFSN